MLRRLLFFVGFLVLTQAASLPNRRDDPIDDEDTYLSTVELIVKYGYPVESYEVTTEDGYILTLHRIPYGKESPEASNKPAVLVQHGLFCSSADFIVTGPEKGLGYILADAGFDVWLGNYRGNTYSRKHESLSSDSAKFWEFSWHENGYYDIPAQIDKILEVTGQEKIFYIGHSMGTTGFYVMGSTRPEYNDKITAMFSLAPIAFMKDIKSQLMNFIAQFVDEIGLLTGLIGLNSFAPSSEFMAEVGKLACSDEAVTQDLCGNLIFLICGFDSQELDESLLPVIMGHTPAGASSRQLIHYGQEIKAGKNFRWYDYGLVENLLKYGSASPPDYDLSKITAPVHLHYSDNDWLAPLIDVNELFEKLGNPAGKSRVPLSAFNHLDYIYATDVKTLLYDTLVSQMKGYL